MEVRHTVERRELRMAQQQWAKAKGATPAAKMEAFKSE